MTVRANAPTGAGVEPGQRVGIDWPEGAGRLFPGAPPLDPAKG